MDNYESNYIVLRTILGPFLSDINKLMSLWYYSVIYLKKKKILAYLFQLKQILESFGLITIKDNNTKFVIDTSGHGGNYRWSIFILENSLSCTSFTKMFVSMYNI